MPRFIRHDLPYAAIPFHGERMPWYGGDLQTLRNVLLSKTKRLDAGRDLLINVSDGDQLLACLHTSPHKKVKGILIIIHGLAGDYDSLYVRYLTDKAVRSGYHALRVNLRGAGKGRGLAKQSYHAGRSEDIANICDHMAVQFQGMRQYLCAFSLGGTMAVNLVTGPKVPSHLAGVASFCAPLDMVACAEKFHRKRNFLYGRHFTNALISQTLSSAIPEGLEAETISQLSTVREFDDYYTSFVAGYEGADDYYRGTTPLANMDKITVPSLVVHSDNDPWIPVDAYQKIKTHNALFCVITRGGGHVGFHGAGQNYECWQSEMAVQYFDWLHASKS